MVFIKAKNPLKLGITCPISRTIVPRIFCCSVIISTAAIRLFRFLVKDLNGNSSSSFVLRTKMGMLQNPICLSNGKVIVILVFIPTICYKSHYIVFKRIAITNFACVQYIQSSCVILVITKPAS